MRNIPIWRAEELKKVGFVDVEAFAHGLGDSLPLKWPAIARKAAAQGQTEGGCYGTSQNSQKTIIERLNPRGVDFHCCDH